MRNLFAAALATTFICSGEIGGGLEIYAAWVPAVPEGAVPMSIRPISLRPGSGDPGALVSGIHGARRQVIRDPVTWGAVWAEIHAGQGAPPPVPDVDFTFDMVLLAAMGDRPSGGYAIRSDALFLAPDGAIITGVTSTTPGPGCATTAGITQPVDAVVVSRSASISFTERTMQFVCR